MTIQINSVTNCPTCGSDCKINCTDEGTHSFAPITEELKDEIARLKAEIADLQYSLYLVKTDIIKKDKMIKKPVKVCLMCGSILHDVKNCK